jgi:KAP family P-loop domain
MWPDNETAEDLIGFQVHADLIRDVVTDPRMLPVTIGVFGDWGGGKTSIMKMLERDLDPETFEKGSVDAVLEKGVAVIYLNPWLFEGYDDAKSAVLSSVLSQLRDHKRFGPKIREKATALLRSVNWMRVLAAGGKYLALPAAAAFLTGGAAAIPGAIAAATGLGALAGATGDENAEKTPQAEASKIDPSEFIKHPEAERDLDVRKFRERFAKMLAESDIKTLVILIDDLDRCTPDRIVESLEAIKLFLSVERTAFVIGADQRIVQHAIRSRFAQRATDARHDEDNERLVKDYLEKLIQVPYRLPRLSATEIETYMALLFCQLYLRPELLAGCLAACREQRGKNRYATFGHAAVKVALAGQDPGDELFPALGFCAAAAPLIADGLKGNPRQVKRFLNALLLRKQLARVAKLGTVQDAALVKLMILEYAHEELFLQLFQWQSQQEGHPKELEALEKAIKSDGQGAYEEAIKKTDPKWATQSIRRWVAMDPPLSEIDLRDYFWIARDRLESTFSGLSMVPPAVRLVLEGLFADSAKRKIAVRSASSLSTDETSSLLGLIEQRITRQPDQATGYEALRALVEADFVEAAERLAALLTTLPEDKIPAGVGMDVATLLKAKPKLRPTFTSAIERLSKSTSRSGAAFKLANKP